MKDNTRRVEQPMLLAELCKLLAKCREGVGQERVFRRIVGLVMAELFNFGRHTITQLLMTLGLVADDWSGWYRLFSKKRFAEEKIARIMLKEVLEEVEEEETLVVGVDGFPVPRCSLKMPGTGWMRGLQTARFKPGIQRGQRFVEGSWLTPMEEGYSRAVPLRCLPAFTRKAVPCKEAEPCSEVSAALKILRWIQEVMKEAGRQKQQLLALLDGAFDRIEFWKGLPEGAVAVVRTARNRALYYLPGEDAHGNRRYGKKLPPPHTYLRKRKGFKHITVVVRGKKRKMRYRLIGPVVREGLPSVPLFLLVIGGGKRPPGSRRKSYQPCFFLISAVLVDGVYTLPLPIELLLAWLWQRWELEVAHRAMKSALGLGEKQCWNDFATVASVQWSVWVYQLMVLAGIRTWGSVGGPQPPGLWRARSHRWSFNTLYRYFRAELWLLPNFRATWSLSRDNWPENETLWLNLFNSVLASSRA